MKVIIRKAAQDDLDQIAAWISKDNPRAAVSMVSRIRDHMDLLEEDKLAHMGRPGLIEGTRELVEYPYIIIYRVDEELSEVVVLSIVHGARDREGEGKR
jgi:addiction module RelE/StbE family toxin